MSNLYAIIDKHLNWIVNNEINTIDEDIENEMISNENANPDSEGKTREPIKSKVTIDELNEFEEWLGYALPLSYKDFLQYKHFYQLYINETSFFPHPVSNWQKSLAKNIFDGWPQEYHIDKGYIPFADWSDWGILCFDTTQNNADFDYPIVLWDHEEILKFKPIEKNFENLLLYLDAENTKSRNNGGV